MTPTSARATTNPLRALSATITVTICLQPTLTSPIGTYVSSGCEGEHRCTEPILPCKPTFTLRAGLNTIWMGADRGVDTIDSSRCVLILLSMMLLTCPRRVLGDVLAYHDGPQICYVIYRRDVCILTPTPHFFHGSKKPLSSQPRGGPRLV